MVTQLRITKPDADTDSVFILDEPVDVLNFDLISAYAMLSRGGDDLVLNYEDGSSTTLQGFFLLYGGDNLPDFDIEGYVVTGGDFFAALGAIDLMPAIGDDLFVALGGGLSIYETVLGLLGGVGIPFASRFDTSEASISSSIIDENDRYFDVFNDKFGDENNVLEQDDNPNIKEPSNEISFNRFMNGTITEFTYYDEAKTNSDKEVISTKEGNNDIISGKLLGDGATIFAGGGTDTITIATMTGGVINAGDEADIITIDIKMTGGTIIAGLGDDAITIGEMTAGNITAGAGNNTITIGEMTTGKINTGAGNNVITIGTMSGDITVGAGDDTIIIGEMSGGTIIAGLGNDTITIGEMTAGNIDAGAGNDIVKTGTITPNAVNGGAGFDFFIGLDEAYGMLDAADSFEARISGNGSDQIVNLAMLTSLGVTIIGDKISFSANWTSSDGLSYTYNDDTNPFFAYNGMLITLTDIGHIYIPSPDFDVLTSTEYTYYDDSGERQTVASGTIGDRNLDGKIIGAVMVGGTIIGGDSVESISIAKDFDVYSKTSAILGGVGDNVIDIGWNISSSASASVTIDSGKGDDTINIGGYVYSSSSSLIIDAGIGDDVINIARYLYASSSASITIDGGAGDDTINIEGYVDAAKSSSVLIDGETGNDIIRMGGAIYTDGAPIIIKGGAGFDFFIGDSTTYSKYATGFEARISENGSDKIENLATLTNLGVTIIGVDANGNGDSITLDSTMWTKSGLTYTYKGEDTAYTGMIITVIDADKASLVTNTYSVAAEFAELSTEFAELAELSTELAELAAEPASNSSPSPVIPAMASIVANSADVNSENSTIVTPINYSFDTIQMYSDLTTNSSSNVNTAYDANDVYVLDDSNGEIFTYDPSSVSFENAMNNEFITTDGFTSNDAIASTDLMLNGIAEALTPEVLAQANMSVDVEGIDEGWTTGETEGTFVHDSGLTFDNTDTTIIVEIEIIVS